MTKLERAEWFLEMLDNEYEKHSDSFLYAYVIFPLWMHAKTEVWIAQLEEKQNAPTGEGENK